jgi:hypothetical protein
MLRVVALPGIPLPTDTYPTDLDSATLPRRIIAELEPAQHTPFTAAHGTRSSESRVNLVQAIKP